MGTRSSLLLLAAVVCGLAFLVTVEVQASRGLQQDNPLCKVSEWSDWKPCARTAGGKMQEVRTRTIIDDPNPEEPCTHLTESRKCTGTAAAPPPKPPAKSAALKKLAETMATALPAATDNAMGDKSTPTASAITEWRKKINPRKLAENLLADLKKSNYGVTGRIVYDGDNGYFFKVEVATDNKLVGKLSALFDQILYNTQPWLVFNDELADKKDALLDMSFGYDTATKTATFSASTGNYLFLIDMLKERLRNELGITIPETENPATDAATGEVRLVVSKAAGIEIVYLALGGSWTPMSIGKRLGFDWPVPEDLITISKVSVEYVAADASLALGVTTSIPSAGITNTVATLMVQRQGMLSLEIDGEIAPVSWLVINNLKFEISKAGGIQASAAGVIAGISLKASISVTKAATSFTLVATDVKIGKLINDVLTKELKINVPSVVSDFLAPISFYRITISYVNRQFEFSASPDVSEVPFLKKVMDMADAKPEDFVVGYTPLDGVYVRLSKTFLIPMPKPFEGDGKLQISTSVDRRGLVFFGRFSSGINIPGIKQNPVVLSVGAGISATAEITIEAASVTPISFEKFPAFELTYLNVSCTFLVGNPVPTELRIAGRAILAGAILDAQFIYAPKAAQMAFKASISNLNLGAVLNAFGVKVDLGAFGFNLEELFISYSTVDIPALDIVMGMRFKCKVTVLGMVTKAEFEVTPSGTKLGLSIDASEATKAFSKAVVGTLDARLTEFIAELEGKGSKKVAEDLKNARERVEILDQDLANAKKKFADFKAERTRAFEDAAKLATQLADTVAALFDKARKELETAEKNWHLADAAFEAAKAKAREKILAAQRDVDRAQADFNREYKAAEDKVIKAQDDVNRMRNNLVAKRGLCARTTRVCVFGWCNNVPAPDLGACAEIAIIEAAVATASGALTIARGFLDKIVNTGVGAALNVARGVLTDANKAANDLIGGTQDKAAQAAKKIFELAKGGADLVKKTAEYAKSQDAQKKLDIAEKLLDAVVGSAEQVAIVSVTATRDIALGVLAGAEAIANKGIQYITELSKDAVALLKTVESNNFLQLGVFELNAEITTAKKAFAVKMSVIVQSKPLSLALSVDLADPFTTLRKAVFDKAWAAITDGVKKVAEVFGIAL